MKHYGINVRQLFEKVAHPDFRRSHRVALPPAAVNIKALDHVLAAANAVWILRGEGLP